jgi:uncharacterized protein
VSEETLETELIGQLLQHDPAAATARLLVAARSGDGLAQALLGQIYLDGTGVARDTDEALYWFQHAAHQHVPMAMNMLGRCYENGWGAAVDYTLAATWYRHAANHGLDWAIYNYAHLLAHGRGVEQDRALAFEWFSRAAGLGHARAMHFLGMYYEHGWEVAADLDKAFDLYRRSAEGGDYRGQCSWASVLAGWGRIDEAERLLQHAAQHAPAHYLMALADELEASLHGAFRTIAASIRTRLATSG